LSGTCFSQNCSIPFGNRDPNVTHCSSGQAHSSSQTASRSVQPFCIGCKCYTVQCIVDREENPQNCPFPWDFVTLSEEDRATAIGNTHRKIGKDRACGSGYILADRNTGMLITVLRNRSRARSNKCRLMFAFLL